MRASFPQPLPHLCSGWDEEVQSYSSTAVYAQLKLGEALHMARELPRPHPVHCATVCHVFDRIQVLFGRYQNLIQPLWRELLVCIFADTHRLPRGMWAPGAEWNAEGSEVLLELEPWFAKYDRMARRCAQLEDQLMRGQRRVAEATGAAQARDAQLVASVQGWQRELVRIKALADTGDGTETLRVTLGVLQAQVRELTLQLQAANRELGVRHDQVRAAREEAREARQLQAPQAAEEIRRLFRTLHGHEQTALVRELADIVAERPA